MEGLEVGVWGAEAGCGGAEVGLAVGVRVWVEVGRGRGVGGGKRGKIRKRGGKGRRVVREGRGKVPGKIGGKKRRKKGVRRAGFVGVSRGDCLVIRAGDTRWEGWGLLEGDEGEVGHWRRLTGDPLRKARVRELEEKGLWGGGEERGVVRVSGGMIRRLCEPVRMEGAMTVDALALRLGIPKHTVWRGVFRGVLKRVDGRGEGGVMPWDREGMLRVREEVAKMKAKWGKGGEGRGWDGVEDGGGDVGRRVAGGGSRRKGRVLVWTDRAPDPGAGRLGEGVGGEVWERLREKLEDGFEQEVARVREFGGRRKGLGGGWRWECPGCGRRCLMLYLGVGREGEGRGLGCGRCLGVQSVGGGREEGDGTMRGEGKGDREAGLGF